MLRIGTDGCNIFKPNQKTTARGKADSQYQEGFLEAFNHGQVLLESFFLNICADIDYLKRSPFRVAQIPEIE